MHATARTYVRTGQKITCGSQLPPTTWAPEKDRRSLGLVTSTLTHQSIPLASCVSFCIEDGW